MAIIAVHGTASRALPAELTVAHLSVEVTNVDRDAAIAQARAVHSKIVSDIEKFLGDGTAAWVSAPDVGAWVTPQWVVSDEKRPKDGLQQVIRHRAGGDIDICFTDTAALSAWLSDVANTTGVVVHPVTWDITDITRHDAIRALRSAAAQDAVARATDYSSALGLRYVRLSTLHEHEDSAATEPGAPHPGETAGGAGAHAHPRMIELAVTVDAEFNVE